MFDRDIWQEIFATMRKHQLRTGLTALGVFWGIFMLVFILGMGKGLENGVFRGFDNRVSNALYVWPMRTSQPYKGFQPGRVPRFTLEDIRAIQQEIPEIRYIAPRHSMPASPVYFEDKGDRYEIRGELSDMIKVESLKLYEGRYVNELDVAESRKVAVIGQRIREVLFGDAECLGRYVRIRGVEFLVVGVFGPIQIKP